MLEQCFKPRIGGLGLDFKRGVKGVEGSWGGVEGVVKEGNLGVEEGRGECVRGSGDGRDWFGLPLDSYPYL